MNQKIFIGLTESEIETVKKAPIYVGLLIAAADQNISSRELHKIAELIHIKTYSEEEAISEIYKIIDTNDLTSVYKTLSALPSDSTARMEELISRLEDLNPIFKKIDLELANEYLESLRNLAVHVANASGGFLGLNPINEAEQKLIDLPMIELPS